MEQWDAAKYLSNTNNIAAKIVARHYIRRTTYHRNKALKYANAVVTISEWHRTQLLRYNTNTYVIYNGFNEQQASLKPLPSEFFYITYSGKIYNLNLRNPQLLFSALHNMFARHTIDRERTRVVFYIEQEASETIRRLADEYGLGDSVEIRHFISPQELLHVMQQSSICLILNNPSTHEQIHGIIPSKFFEALGAQRPVLCVPADHDSLQEIVEQTHAGLCTDNEKQIETFISSLYRQWEKQRYVVQPTTQQQREPFARAQQVKQYEQIIQTITHDA